MEARTRIQFIKVLITVILLVTVALPFVVSSSNGDMVAESTDLVQTINPEPEGIHDLEGHEPNTAAIVVISGIVGLLVILERWLSKRSEY
jgi:hypothetical protein